MAALHASAFRPAERWGVDAIVLQLELSGAFGLLALQAADEPAGFVLARVVADEAEILTLAVHPSARRQGLANLLLQAAETQAELAGATSMFLEVADCNIGGRALYSGRRYRQVGLRRRYYASGADALVMRHDLGGMGGLSK